MYIVRILIEHSNYEETLFAHFILCLPPSTRCIQGWLWWNAKWHLNIVCLCLSHEKLKQTRSVLIHWHTYRHARMKPKPPSVNVVGKVFSTRPNKNSILFSRPLGTISTFNTCASIWCVMHLTWWFNGRSFGHGLKFYMKWIGWVIICKCLPVCTHCIYVRS